MPSHFGLLVLFALLVAVVLATLVRDDRPGQVRLGMTMLAGLVGSAVVLGWILYLFPL
jgi:heme A synthase